MKKTLIGYSDTLSVAAGESIEFKVSNDAGTQYEAQIVRVISGDTNPAGPGYREHEVEDACWTLRGRAQRVRSGSCIIVPACPALRLDSLKLDILIWPTSVHKAGQVVASFRDPARGAGFQVVIEEEGRLALHLADGSGKAARLHLEAKLYDRRWFRISATFDAASGVASLVQTPLSPLMGGADSGAARADVSLGSLRDIEANFVIGARLGEAWEFEGFFNGKVESPRLAASLCEHASALGEWDFSLGIGSTIAHDLSRHGHDGYTVQLPARGVTGALWDGSARAWTQCPAHYGAIHLHDDDLQDAGWKTDFEWKVPSDLQSGLYAARLRSRDDEDYVPFVVRASVQPRRCGLVFLVPTASYLAYANEHMAFDLPQAERVHDHVPVLGPNELHVAEHRELGNSLYDMHADCSPVYYSSRLRPILNMRPKMQSWLGGGTGSGLWQLNADTHLLAWLEHEAIPFDCVTDEDLDREGAALLEGYSCLMTGTHPEYWSTRMRDALDSFQAGGGRTMYMGGNGLYWRIAYDPAGSGTIEVRRGDSGTPPGENHHSMSGEYGGVWRRIGRPPQQSVGVGFVGQGFDICSYFRRMPDSGNPRVAFIFEGVDDEIIGDFGLIGGGAAGIELDRADFREGTPLHALILARSENHTANYLTSVDLLPINCLGAERANPIYADMLFYETPAGGAVFSTGSISWAGSLAHNGYDNNVAAISRNVVNRFVSLLPFNLNEAS